MCVRVCVSPEVDPVGIPKGERFSWSEETVEDIRRRNPDLKYSRWANALHIDSLHSFYYPYSPSLYFLLLSICIFFSIYSRHCLMQYCAENHGWLFYWKYNSATKRLLHWWSLAIFWITFQICLTRKSVLAFSFNRDHSSWAPIKRTVWWQKSQLH